MGRLHGISGSGHCFSAPQLNFIIDFLHHLISLNKYVVTLILNQANSCLTYNSLAQIFDFGLVSNLKITIIEKILLLVTCCNAASIRELFFQKFVVSSIIRCLKI